MEPARLPTNLGSGEDRHRNFIIATTNESQGKFFPKAELVWGGGIADDCDDDDGETSFICHRPVKRSSRQKSPSQRASHTSHPNAHPMGKSRSNESGEVDTLAVLGPTLLA